MYPKGFVAAASITSHTSTPSRSQIIAISLTRPMLIMRKVFSSSFASSALSGERDLDDVVDEQLVDASAELRALRSDAAEHFGRVARVPLRVPRIHALR